MNKRGFTVVELITTVTMVSVVALLLIRLTISLKELYIDSDVKTTLIVKKSTITEAIYSDINRKVLKSLTSCGNNCIEFEYTDTTKQFIVEENKISYGNFSYKLLSSSSIGEFEFIESENGIYNFKLPITDKLVDGDYGINITFHSDELKVGNDISIEPEGSNEPKSFSTDSWLTIATAIKDNNTSVYNVGDTKDIQMDLDNDGNQETYQIRIANTNTPSECTTTQGFSQSACGFVFEFTGIISVRTMRDSRTSQGGWPATDVRTYLNSTTDTNSIYNKLPSDLRELLADTTVVSGHGNASGDSSNFTSTDKLYLLSKRELGFDTNRDTAGSLTKPLEYYSSNSNSLRIKTFNGTATEWWERTPRSGYNNRFITVNNSGGDVNYGQFADTEYGVSPAFKIEAPSE